jgi:ABC-2 type transport system permease protein
MTKLAATPARPGGHAGPQPVTPGKVMHSEWIKLRTARSSWILLGVTAASIAAIGLLVAYASNAHWHSMTAGDRADFSPVNQTLIGVILAELTVGILGVLAATGEYATGMIRATFAAVPRRLPVLAAKAGVLATVTFAVCLAAVFTAFAGGQALLGAHGISLSHPGALRAVFGAALYLTVVAVLGVGLGFLIRSTAGGIAAIIGVLLVLPVIVSALPGSLSITAGRYLPSTAGRALYVMNSGSAMPSPWAGFAIFAGYAAVVVACAALTLRRRDA